MHPWPKRLPGRQSSARQALDKLERDQRSPHGTARRPLASSASPAGKPPRPPLYESGQSEEAKPRRRAPVARGFTSEDLSLLVEPTVAVAELDGPTIPPMQGIHGVLLCCSPVKSLLGYALLPCDEPQQGGSSPEAMVSEQENKEDRARLLRHIRRCVRSVLQSIIFQCFTVSCIIANAAIIGAETDHPDNPLWDHVETAFLWVFSLEVLCRLFIAGFKGFFCGLGLTDPGAPFFKRKLQAEAEFSEVVWNVFDFTIVGTGWGMIFLETFASAAAKSTSDATLLRVVRLLRLLRILRVVRVVRFLKQLYLLAYGFLEGASAVFWVAVLAASLIYLCAVVLVRCFHSKSPEDESFDFFETHFHDVPGAMFTLFELMASPTLNNYREVLCHSPLLAIFIVLFVIFGSFGMNGLLTGVISESIMEKNQARLESQRQEREAKRRWLETSFSQLFDDLIGHSGGQMCRDQFIAAKEEILSLIAEGGVSVVAEDLDSMFLAMDFNDRGLLDKADFVHGILELCEEVRPMSIMEIHCQLSRCQCQIEQVDTHVLDLVSAMRWGNKPLEEHQAISPQTADTAISSGPALENLTVSQEKNHFEGCAGGDHLRALEMLQTSLASGSCDSATQLKQLAGLGRALTRLAQQNSALVEEQVLKGLGSRSEPGDSGQAPSTCRF